ncbi:8-oxoguanine glycosylase ogg1 [Stylosanthes scabra]|uniref:8-oxoguanine glycosylase ogg1 n=1 Tax=Stylosanthes scabra TaxID=79078 RepID=A0ABU6XAQ7_9FABA|nr:8-oxoguanine glycosylase ogg1 [Stylosanthes scabra]
MEAQSEFETQNLHQRLQLHKSKPSIELAQHRQTTTETVTPTPTTTSSHSISHAKNSLSHSPSPSVKPSAGKTPTVFSELEARFAQLAEYLGGSRVFLQDPFEYLIQFLCSSNNNIKRIIKMVVYVSRTYLGTVEGFKFHAFPTLEQLSVVSEEQLQKAGFGYKCALGLYMRRAMLATPSDDTCEERKTRSLRFLLWGSGCDGGEQVLTWRGRVPGVYHNWLECKRQVTGFRNNEFRGFHNREEAEAWLAVEQGTDGGGNSAEANVGQVMIPQRLEMLRGSTRTPSCGGGSSSNNSESSERVWDDLRIPNEGPVMHMEDMELMLMRACAFFGVGLGGEWHSVWVQRYPAEQPHRGLELVAHGSRSMDETMARQDAAFVMLEKLLSATRRSLMSDLVTVLGRICGAVGVEP